MINLTAYTKENLKAAIYKTMRSLWIEQPSDADLLIDTYIVNRIGILLYQCRNFYIESDYDETEWRDMIALHYVHTSYRVENRSVRIHFFEDKLEKYLGYITLRRINEYQSMLSRICPDFNNARLDPANISHIIGFKKDVNVETTTFETFTYPCLVQDGAVAACTQANLWTICQFLNNEHGVKELRMREIDQGYAYMRAKIYPSKGLRFSQMLEIFNNKRIAINAMQVAPDTPIIREQFARNTKVYIESKTPVILGFREHVIQIIGRIDDITNGEVYLAYDDSGYMKRAYGEYLIKWDHLEDDDNSFIIKLNWTKIMNEIGANAYIIAPEPENIFSSPDDLLENVKTIEGHSDLLERFQIFDDKDLLKKARILFVRNVTLRKFLEENVIVPKDPKIKTEVESRLEQIYQMSVPTYFWYMELPFPVSGSDGTSPYYGCFIADPTYLAKTGMCTFFNKRVPFFLKDSLVLLEKNGGS